MVNRSGRRPAAARPPFVRNTATPASGGRAYGSGPAPSRDAVVATYVVLALFGFAGNSLLARMALSTGAIDVPSFMVVRTLSGAITLAALAGGRTAARSGSWVSAITFAAYAVAFTSAYLRVGAGVGALLLFGSVQATMIGWGMIRGERPRLVEWLGLALAVSGLVVLTARGLTAPDPLGSSSMILAGVGWGVYSLRGRGGGPPLAANAGNFVKAVPLTLLAAVLMRPHPVVTVRGLLLATVCGSVTTGLAYTAWYAALPRLTAWRAAIVQLAVPVITAAGAVLFLREPLTVRVMVAAAAIIGGVLLSMAAVRRGPPSAETDNRRSSDPAD